MVYRVLSYDGPQEDKEWKVKHDGKDRASSLHRTRKAAIRNAKRYAHNHNVDTIVVHQKNNGSANYSLVDVSKAGAKRPKWMSRSEAESLGKA